MAEPVHPLFPVEIIFTILTLLRRHPGISRKTLKRKIQRRGLLYGNLSDRMALSFWLRLCQAASLCDGMPLYPTLHAATWLELPFPKKLQSLLNAWAHIPGAGYFRSYRRWLLERLQKEGQVEPGMVRKAPGLQRLGLMDGGHLTPAGRFVFGRDSTAEIELEGSGWILERNPGRELEGLLTVPNPPDWRLLWDLEATLDPLSPGKYLLNAATLRLAVQRGAVEGDEQFIRTRSLPAVLERGLGHPAPVWLLTGLRAQPVLKAKAGVVLSFSDPQELLRLRAAPGLRPYLQEVLSPRHVFLEPWQAFTVIRRLARAGILGEQDLEILSFLDGNPSESTELGEAGVNPSLRLSKGERTYLLSLLLFVENTLVPLAPPPGLLQKLARGLNAALCQTAAIQASRAADSLKPAETWQPEYEPPEIPASEMLQRLNAAIQAGSAIDILYQKKTQALPEHRRISPVALEQRGMRYYLIAYCHTRRANRTFRLDRIKILAQPPDQTGGL